MAREPTPLEEGLGYVFREPALLEHALTHRSGAHEAGRESDYERLEFLGDAVLGLVAAHWLFGEHQHLPEGRLSSLRSHLVSAGALAAYARELGLGEHLVLGQGEEQSGGRDKQSLLADSLEAVIAAVYLDGGLAAAEQVVRRHLLFASEVLDVETLEAKSLLQERVQALGLEPPTYRVIHESGPDHHKTFDVEVIFDGRVAAAGSGSSKKRAEREAARAALRAAGWESAAPGG
jgi:ribonuclease-3